MSYKAKILADSISPHGVRLTTMEVTFPRIVLAEFNTHRMLSRSSASSRAIPVEKRLADVEANPFIPEAFGRNRPGMQATENLEGEEDVSSREVWMNALESALLSAHRLAKLGVHKQLANRLLEPFSWHTCIVTATEWENFFALRCHPDAQPEIQTIAILMRELLRAHTPVRCRPSEWHRPLMDDWNDLLDCGYYGVDLSKISIGRCARVSYLTHDGRRDPDADIALCDKLLASGHMSPFEHVARPMSVLECNGSKDFYDPSKSFRGNLRGWVSVRKTIPNEDNFAKASRQNAGVSGP